MGQYNSHPTLRGSTSSKQVDALPTPNRLELRDFVQDTKMFSLFIQALDVLYQRPLEDKFSWAALSGIHGAPYVQWGNSGDRNPPSERPFAGYCTHGSVLFPTWHRAYVALFEAINEVAIQIAGRYIVNAPMWLEAAKNLRVPYWDWAGPIPAGEPDIPSEITSTTVDITTSEGIKTVKNPLYWFPFPSKFPYTSFPSPHYSWGTTLRYPSSDQPNAECRMDVLSGTYAQNRNQLRTKTYNMLTRLTSWEHFSNHTAKQLPATANSLEAVHDDVHNLVGGLEPFLGHMSDTSTAAFDAVFLLHHANIDRLLSLWQAMNPEDWVTHGTQPGGTHTIEDGGTVDLNTDLAPFWRTQKSYWTSVDVRDWEHALNYSYPEFDGLESSSPMQIREGILDVVDKLYSPVSSLPWQRKDGTYQLQIDSPARPPINARLLHEWTIHIRFKKFELGRSYSILVHLGEMYVGSVSAFTSSAAQKCGRCRNNWDIELEGFIHLDEVLKLSSVPTLSTDMVQPFLAEHLRVEVKGRKPDGTLANIEHDLPSLKVAPFSQAIHLDTFYGVPNAGKVTYHHDILVGKPGHTPADRW